MKKTAEERFWEYVAWQSDTSICWEYQRYCNKDGYGVFYAEGRLWLANRWAYKWAYGDPKELSVLHTCDNPPCCNPHHLYAGTPVENSRDMRDRGRGACNVGEMNGNATLTSDNVELIRRVLAEQSEYGLQAALARQFGVTRAMICHIAKGRNWT